MKRALRVLGLLVLLFLFTQVALASSYFYSIAITVTNTGSAQTNLVAFATIDNSNLATQNFIATDGLNTAVEETGTARLYLPRNNRVALYLPSLAVNETRTYTYYLGYSPAQADFKFMAGQTGYVATADAASLEPGGSNFEVEWKGYFDATKTGSLLEKEDAYGLDVVTAGTARAYFAATSYLYPDAAGDLTDVPSQQPASTFHYDKVDDPVGSPDDGSTYIYNGTVYLEKIDYYNITDLTIPSGSSVLAVYTTIRGYTATSPPGGIYRPYLRLGGVSVAGTTRTNVSPWATYTETIARPGGGSWSSSDFNALQVGAGLQAGWDGDITWGTTYVTQVYVTVVYGPVVTYALASGIHTIKATRTTNTLELFTDTVSRGTATSAVTVTNTTNTGKSAENGPAVYTEYAKVSIAGTQQLWYQPNTIVLGTNLPDRSGQGNVGIITWGSDPVSGVAVSAASAVPANPTSLLGTGQTEPNFLPTFQAPTPINPISVEPVNVPFYPLWQGIGQAGGINTYWVVVPFYLLFALAGLAICFKLGLPAWFSAVVGGVVLVAGLPVGIFDWWVPVIYGIFVATIIVVKSWVFQ